MPSLKQLEEFQKSFLKMGHEPEVNIELQRLADEHPLPESEPTGTDPFEDIQDSENLAGDDDGFSLNDLPGDENAGSQSTDDLLASLGADFLPPGSAEAGGTPSGGRKAAGDGETDDFSLLGDGGLDFSAFLDTVPDDLPADNAAEEPVDGADEAAGPAPDAAETEAPADEALDLGAFPDLEGTDAGETNSAAEDNFDPGFPDDLLNGFAQDIEEGRADTGEEAESPGVEGPDEGGLDLGGDFELPDAEFGESPGPEGPDAGGLDVPAGAEPLIPGMEESALTDSDLEALPLPEEDESALVPSWNPDGIDLDAEKPQGPDSFETFNVEGDVNLGSDLENKSASSEGFGAFDDSFALAGLDDTFSGSAVKLGAQESALEPVIKIKRGRGARDRDFKPEKIEEINLTEEQFNQLRDTIDSYPLNLRVACEEILAEQVVAPELMSSFIKLLVNGGASRDAAILAGKILGRTITIPRGFEKRTGLDLEAERASFSYIFVHKFLPIAAVFLMIILAAASLFYLGWQFVYIPLHAESIYKLGYDRIKEGEYERANERFTQAFRLHRVKNWFYKYAEAFREERQYLYAEEKYDELLQRYPRDKKGALDYAAMETDDLHNYSKAERIIRNNILDYALNDREGLLALGDINLAWGEEDPGRYEEARSAYARLLERYGWQDPIVERMLLYFMRTDNLAEVIPLQQYFDEAFKRKIQPRTLAELGGYLLDKRLEVPDGVPDENIGRIQGLRNLLLRTVRLAPALPEAHYHLARYYHDFGNADEERYTLERAISAFDAAPEESSKRIRFRIDTERRYAELLTKAREFFKAEEHLVKAAGIFEDAVSRRQLSRAGEYGRLYAGLGDLEYFTKSGNMGAAIAHYQRAEQNGWAPPEMQYRMGAAYYQTGQWQNALERLFEVSEEMPLNRRLLHALGNVSYQRGNFYAAQGYYNRLLNLLDSERSRFPVLTPNDRPDHLELAERLMVAQNNLGVAMEALTQRTGDPSYRAQALGLYAESSRAWDALTRDPETMIRSGAGEFSTPGINLAYLNSRNLLYPRTGYEPDLYLRIDKDVLEPSAWEELAPQGYRISGLE
ncbi:MAG: tetratricopeptide repeat protein [Treponema sp.]|jgi:tetratricopeptide (TPR) repeat protein|nr:tetratricopeptide repeat protein [Treponema sp.]